MGGEDELSCVSICLMELGFPVGRFPFLALHPRVFPEEVPWGQTLLCAPCHKYLLWRHICSRVGWLSFGELTPSAAFSR